MAKAIVWFRKDLRLEDNPALDYAIQNGFEIIPVFIYAPEEESFKLGSHKVDIGSASKVWLHYALKSIPELLVRQGASLEELSKLIEETSATHIFWNRRYEPFIIERDKKIKEELSKQVSVESFNGSLLIEPWEVANKQALPYRVFTPYYKSIKDNNFGKPLAKHKLKKTKFKSLKLEDLSLLPEIEWHKSIVKFWNLEKPNTKFLDKFSPVKYSDERDMLALNGTSKVAPYLAWGQLSPRQIWFKFKDINGAESYIRQLFWREFSYHLLYHFPHTINESLSEKFKNFKWEPSSKNLKKWQGAKTGFDVVDAAMNQLWETGWMHNRARMVVASFLTKDLLIPWQEGASWFWDTLVDADLANNTMGWQWVAGCGADASPFYRIFNPETQAEKFDPDDIYRETWLQEKVEPMVDHKHARERALELYKAIK